MDGPTSNRSLWLGMDAEVHRPRSRVCLWRNFPGGFALWAFATDQLYPSRHGRMAIRNVFSPHQFSADYTITMFGFDFREGQPAELLGALFGNVTNPFADLPVDELIGGLQ